jgi:hypothetical protein
MHKSFLETGDFWCDFQVHMRLFMCIFMDKTATVGSLN